MLGATRGVTVGHVCFPSLPPMLGATRGVTVSMCAFLAYHRLAGLVVKASASRVEDPGFEARLRRDFFGVESYQ